MTGNRGNKPGACRRLGAGVGKLVELGKSRGTAMVIITCLSILIGSNSLAQPIGGIPY